MNKNNIQLLAIGIGHDVSKYYKNAFVIEDAKNLGDVIIDNLALMLKLKNKLLFFWSKIFFNFFEFSVSLEFFKLSK